MQEPTVQSDAAAEPRNGPAVLHRTH
jgi:hypothetical protein